MPHLGAAYAGCLILLQLPADGLLLAADEIGINAGFVYQLFVFALLHDASVVDNKYLIRMAHGFQPVCDHYDRFVPRERLDGFLQSVLIFGVNIRRCLVKNNYRRILQHGARDREALALAAGKTCSALAYDRVIAVRQSVDKVIAAGGSCRRDHLLVRCVGSAELDVVFDGVGKQINILEHNAYLIHERSESVILHVIPAYPYVLISILSALHDGVFTAGEVQGDLSMLFDKQYILTENVVVGTRYRTETSTDPETGETTSEEVPYDYYICYVTLENFDLSHVPVYIMDEEKLSFYALYMSTLGNRPDLFSGSQYPNASTLKPPTYYDVPPEALEDATFAAMLKEAEKYIGYPYVWGGSSPSTSFDCSGFISWVINHSGWSVGRLGAQGLYNICTPVSASQAKPGDLVFFVGTYDTPGVSHVGLYVGDSMVLHCGAPISYTNLNSNYWQSHFYSYGRLLCCRISSSMTFFTLPPGCLISTVESSSM